MVADSKLSRTVAGMGWVGWRPTVCEVGWYGRLLLGRAWKWPIVSTDLVVAATIDVMRA
jgi:hypothetical protein